MLYFNLLPIFRARNILNPFTFLVKNGLTPNVAHNMLKSNTRSLRLETVEILCKALNCEPNDLISWQPNNNEIANENHPLFILKPEKEIVEIMSSFNKLPFKQLKKVAKNVIENNLTQSPTEPPVQ